MKIITISGVDGSGKSTQTSLLEKNIRDTGGKPLTFHAISFSLANRRKNFRAGRSRAVTQASWIKIQMRKTILLMDLLRFEFHIAKKQKEGYTHLVSDRYFYDSLINILYLSRKKKSHSFGIDLLAKLIPVPEYAFYLSVSPEVIRDRSRNIEQSESYLICKSKLLAQNSVHWGMILIDGNRDIDTITHEIKKHIA